MRLYDGFIKGTLENSLSAGIERSGSKDFNEHCVNIGHLNVWFFTFLILAAQKGKVGFIGS